MGGAERLPTVAACVAVAVVVTVLSNGLPAVPGLLVPSSDAPARAPQDVAPTLTAADEGDASGVHVQLPTRLRPGAMSPVRLSWTVPGSLPADDLVEVRLQVEAGAGLRGRVWIDPPRELVRVDELHRARFGVGVLPTVPCDHAPGQLRVELTPLRHGAEEVETTRSLPPVACDSPDPPAASASVHLDTPVCGDDWRQQVELLVAGETPPPAPCRPAPSPPSGRAPGSRDGPEPDDPDEPDEPEDGEPIDATDGTEDDEDPRDEDGRDESPDEDDDEDRPDEDEDRDDDGGDDRDDDEDHDDGDR